MGLYSGMLWVRRSSAERKQLFGEIKELEVERDNMISTANLKGKTWDSLGSKEAILNKIKVRSTVPKYGFLNLYILLIL